MGLFSSMFAKRGLSNSSTNMRNPLGRSECLRLCSQYDNSGGYKMSSRMILGTPTGPGMELYEIFRKHDATPEPGYVVPYSRHRGIVFAKVYHDDVESVELRVVEYEEWMDGQGRISGDFSRVGTLEHVSGDLYRSPTPFTVYIDKQKMSTIAEVNWNTATNEFVYREIYTPVKDEGVN